MKPTGINIFLTAPPKMDGENNGKPYEQMDDLGGKPTIFGNIHVGNYLSFMDPFSFNGGYSPES